MLRISGDSQAEAISPIHRIFYESQSDTVRLGQRIGTGAEGEVYEIQAKSDLVAKIYHEPPPPEKAEKLVVLSRLGNERLFNLSAWPVSTLRDAPDGEVVGFVMKKINQAEEVHALHSPKSRLQKFPEASWVFLIYVAANIARAVAAIHEHGMVIGDVNPKNILVTRKATVYLLDVDSFQVSAEGKTYRCEGGFPEYTPPELQGVAFRDIDRAQEHDSFGLGVVIFQLLFMGRHPFSGRYFGAGEMPLERAIREFRFAYGVEAEAQKMRQPPGTLALNSMPPPLVSLFRRAFMSTDRPQAREWIEPLDELAKALKKCELHSGHHYYRELRDCPWCGIESQAGVRLFNFLLPGDDSRRGHFRLDEIWKDIVSVEAPSALQVQWDKQLSPPTPSAEVAAFARDRRNRLILALLFSAFAGLAIPSFANFTCAFFLLILAGLAACAVGKVERTSTVQLLFQRRQPAHDGPLLEKVEARWLLADEAARRLQEQHNREAGSERWGSKRDELQNRKETYENLSQIRQYMFQQLEAEARKSQLYEFLDQFRIDDAEIKGVISPIKAALLSHGVETAADVIEEVSQIPSVGRSQAERLLEWRRSLEGGFVFDSDRGVSPETRVKTEREVDALRFRLESELIGGAHYLRRIKQEIETDSQKLQPSLTRAREELARAEKDLEVVGKRNSPTLILAALIIAFLISWMINTPNTNQYDSTIQVPREDSGGQPAPAPRQFSEPQAEQNEQERSQEALTLYNQGVQLSRERKYAKAAEVFQKAVRIDRQFYEAHQELGYVLYRLGRYVESISSSHQAAAIRSDFRPYYNMGLAYIAQEDWDSANFAFERAITHCEQDSWEEDYSNAYYYWGRSLSRIGQAESAIKELEESLKISPEMTYGRFELATLYLASGKYKEAMAQYRILKIDDPMLANELLKLIKKYRKSA
jgi:DNA-binding helix-hairpin-helix protein with protein kinase domain/Tfp pilus assembly protein PilF